MPVFNSGSTIGPAIEALLHQTYDSFRLIISDNASTDGTREVCEAFAAGDPRITYIRQDTNIGADANFDFVLSCADSEYFMWAAGDDTRAPDFIADNLLFLDTHPDFVGSTSRVRFVGAAYDPVRMGDETRAESSAGDRIARFFDTWHANGRFYGLFRRADLALAKQGLHRFLASDWAVVVRLLARGKTNRLDRGSVDLGIGGTSHAKHFVASFRTRWIHWPLPLWDVTVVTWRALEGQGIAAKAAVLLRLVWLNGKAVWAQLRDAVDRTRRGVRRGAKIT